jgi:hypothetical protein
MFIVRLNKAEVYQSEDFTEAILAYRSIAWHGNIWSYDPSKHDFNGLKICSENGVLLQTNRGRGDFHKSWGSTFIAPETGTYTYGTVGEVEFMWVAEVIKQEWMY